MPELPEVKIMSNFINHWSSDNLFDSIWSVQKGNVESLVMEFESHISINSTTNGKEMRIDLGNPVMDTIWVFMGMSGNWKWVDTNQWRETKFVRLRIDSHQSGKSLILWGGYMGPKWKIGGKFGGTKRGPDPTQNWESFKENIWNNIHKTTFNKPICEVLLNQEYFSGIGNYLRSTILYYGGINPFLPAKEVIDDNLLQLCRDIPLKSLELSGGQLRDWDNPFGGDDYKKKFGEWVFYQKGMSIKDSGGRTFWFDPKWKEYINNREQNNII
jgi:endonuclease VIII-like 1